MRFYYTGAKTLGGEQKISSLSLGGLISGTVVPNSALNNLFTSLTPYSVKKNLDEYILLALKNELGADITDLKINFEWSTTQPKFSTLEIAATIPNNSSFEKINTNTSAPYYATFFSADKPNDVNVGNLKSGAYLGIWIKRKIIKTAFNALISDTNVIAQTYKDIVREDIKLNMSWTNV